MVPPAGQPAPVQQPAPPPPVVDAASVPPPAVRLPDNKGNGLVISAAVVGGVGWGLAMGSMGLVLSGCEPDLENGSVGDCFDRAAAFVALVGLRWVANGTALGLAIPAGIVKGRYDGTRYALEGRPRRNPVGFIAGGAATLGVGVITWVTMRVGFWTFIPECQSVNGCVVGYFLPLQLGWAASAAGAGLMSYGIAYKRRYKSASMANLSVLPQLSPEYGGLALSGRF